MRVVTAQELRDLWLGGRGLVLTFAFSLLLSVVAYLVATNRGLNFLEHRETVNLLLQVAIAVGALLALLTAADTISGERERGTLESLLLTPVSRLELTLGKLLGALSLWRSRSSWRSRTCGSSPAALALPATRCSPAPWSGRCSRSSSPPSAS